METKIYQPNVMNDYYRLKAFFAKEVELDKSIEIVD